VNPNTGPTAGGTAVTITGTSFPAAVDSVRVGTGRLGSLVRVSNTQLTGTTPRGSAAGTVDVTVYTTSDNTSVDTASCAGCFTYLLPVGLFARYAVTFLGAGFDSSQAADINDSGAVVGQVWSAATGWQGRLWPNAGAATDLGVLLPVAINNGGSLVGTRPGADTTAALWENGAVRALGGLTAPHAKATDINDQREVALFAGVGGGAYLWRNDSLIVSWEHGVIGVGRMNRWGEVAVTGMGSFGYPQAGVMNAGGGRVLSEGRSSGAAALNDAGWVVGSAESPGFPSYGVLFNCCVVPFYPAAINNSLQIVGGGSIWQDSVTASLTALVLDSTWQVSGASAINERGQIAAYGVNTVTGARGAIRLDPVAPAPGPAAARRR